MKCSYFVLIISTSWAQAAIGPTDARQLLMILFAGIGIVRSLGMR
jgi:hypothetical protein